MRARYTEGPWAVEDGINVYAGGSCLCSAYSQAPAVDAYAIDETDKQARANARLMAAAPDLLEAARAVAQRLHNVDRWPEAGLFEAAIARADGRA